MFEERKAFTIHLPFSPSNESFVKRFISKLNYFTNEKCKFNVVWNTRKVQSLFPLKDKVDHYSCVIYRGDCSCDQNYIGETVRNAKIRWNEHEYKNSKSEPAKHLKRTQPINLHEPSSARLLKTFVSAEYWRHILSKPFVLHLMSN